ncbi:MAG: TerB family tellurite resistance protein [Gammaproteobacteria bacterium]|nr:hypothetical protein [Gammaproteobacteria bacterium]
MLKALTELLERTLGGAAPEDSAERRHAVRVATALLLIEVARADFSEDLTERDETFRALKAFFELTDAEAEMLMEEAGREADRAASLHGFTRRLHETLTADEKLAVIEMLWRVALADRRLDKHEDHLVRKIADLLYVSHADLIRIRNRIRGEFVRS